MKVLHVIDSLGVGGGAEHSLLAMLPEFAARGVKNEVVCLVDREHGLFEQVQRMGIPYSVLPGRHLAAQTRSLRRLVKRIKPDIVHATLVKSSMASRFACTGLPVAQVHSLVNTTYDSSRTTKGGVAGWKLDALRRSDSVTAKLVRGRFHAITDAVKREAVESLGIPAKKITVIPRGRSRATLGTRTEERRLAARSLMGCADDDIIIINVGRQDWIKGQDVLVGAFDTAAETNPYLQLWIAGRDGDASPALSAAIEATHSQARIHLLGHRTDVHDLLCAADILVASSHHEGFGGVLLEAMALECAIIASDADCFREVLGADPVGVVVARGDALGLAVALDNLSSSYPLRRNFAIRARDHYLEHFELQLVVARMLDLYRTVRLDSIGHSDHNLS